MPKAKAEMLQPIEKEYMEENVDKLYQLIIDENAINNIIYEFLLADYSLTLS